MSIMERIISHLYRIILFPIAIGFMVVLMISVFVDTLGLEQIGDNSVIPSFINSLMTLVAVLIVSSVCAAEFNADSNENFAVGLSDAKPWYVRLFILRSIVFVTII